jgi:hypothetical protein
LFFIKEYLGNQSELITYITEDNVFCTCPNCGADVQVDLASVIECANYDLENTAVWCDDCAKEWLKGKSGDNHD